MAEELNPGAQPPPDAYEGIDDKIAAIMGSDSEESAPVEDEPEEEQPEPESDEDQPEPDGDDEEHEPQAGSQREDAEVARAKRNLQLRAHVPKAVLDSMEPEKLVQWWAALATREAGVDEAFRKLSKYEDAQPTEKAESDERAVPTAVPELELPQELADELGEESAKALGAWIKKQVSPLANQLNGLVAQNERLVAERVWSKVAGEGSSLPEGALDKALTWVPDLVKREGPWQSLSGEARAEALLRAAARAEFGEASLQGAKSDRRDSTKRARRNGTAYSPQQRRRQSDETKSDEEVTDALIAAIMSGENDPKASPTKLRGKFGLT